MKTRILGCFALGVVLLVSTSTAFAERNAYLKLKGVRQGDIKGGVTTRGHEDQILVRAYNHEIVNPIDPATGQPTGRRQHKPLTILKEVDKSSPLLYSALRTNENMQEFILRFYMASQTGQETLYFTITLTNAKIAGIKAVMLDNSRPENAQIRFREEVAFTYEKIVWTWAAGGITSEDSWESPNP